MKLTVEKAVLARALARAAWIADGKGTIPILGCALIQAGDGWIEVTGADTDRAITERVPAAVERRGAVAVPARTFSDLIRRCPDGSQVALDLPADELRLSGQAGRARWKLDCLDAADFARFTPPTKAVTLTVPAKDLRLVLGETVMAASTEETRYYLCGVHLRHAELDGRAVLRGEATDGHRLVRFDVPAPAGAAAMPDVIVPAASVEAIVKLLDGVAEPVTLTVSAARLSVTAGAVAFVTKLIEANFPDCDRVIPAGNDKVIEVDPAALIAAVERVATVAIDKTRSIKLACDADGIELSAMGGGVGEVSESVDVSRGAAVTIGFNHRYLLDILGRIGGATARIALSDRASPALITDPDVDHALYVVMPVQI